MYKKETREKRNSFKALYQNKIKKIQFINKLLQLNNLMLHINKFKICPFFVKMYRIQK